LLGAVRLMPAETREARQFARRGYASAVLGSLAARTNVAEQWLREEPKDPDALLLAARVAAAAYRKWHTRARKLLTQTLDLAGRCALAWPDDPTPHVVVLSLPARLKPLTPMRSPVHEFGSLLRELRIRAGLTQPELGAQIHTSKSTVSRAETGGRLLAPDLVAACDALLNASGRLIGLAGRATRPALDPGGSRRERNPLPRAVPHRERRPRARVLARSPIEARETPTGVVRVRGRRLYRASDLMERVAVAAPRSRGGWADDPAADVGVSSRSMSCLPDISVVEAGVTA
jgi:transcriptional regulator with XRE-family HTH domain